MYHIFIKYYDRGDKMAIWNNTYVHGILDVDNGYYIAPFHYNVASYGNGIVFGDNATKTTINGTIVNIDSALNIAKYDEDDYSATIDSDGTISTIGAIIAKSGSFGYRICKSDADEYNAIMIPPRSSQMQFGDDGLKTVVSGTDISLANSTSVVGRLTSYGLTLKNNSSNNYINYGTDDPPIDAVEGQIYFKIIE